MNHDRENSLPHNLKKNLPLIFLLGQLLLIATNNAQARSGLNTLGGRSCSTKGTDFVFSLLPS